MELAKPSNKRTVLISLSVVALLGCAVYALFRLNQGHTLIGQIVWDDNPRTELLEQRLVVLDAVSGTAYLLLEEDYVLARYDGPPTDDVRKRFVVDSDYELWRTFRLPDSGSRLRKKPTGTEPEYLLKTPLDAAGIFRFEVLPPGRHTLFIRWGNNPDPADCMGGPYEVVLGDRKTTEKRFIVGWFDLRST